MQVEIWTDASTINNPGPGAWAAVIVVGSGTKGQGQRYRVIADYMGHTTNGRAELTAALEAMRYFRVPTQLTIYSDAKYLVDSFVKGWIYSWSKNDWRRKPRWGDSEGEKVANPDLMEALLLESERHQVTFVWIKGHSGERFNEMADAAAYKAAVEGYAREQADSAASVGSSTAPGLPASAPISSTEGLEPLPEYPGDHKRRHGNLAPLGSPEAYDEEEFCAERFAERFAERLLPVMHTNPNAGPGPDWETDWTPVGPPEPPVKQMDPALLRSNRDEWYDSAKLTSAAMRYCDDILSLAEYGLPPDLPNTLIVSRQDGWIVAWLIDASSASPAEIAEVIEASREIYGKDLELKGSAPGDLILLEALRHKLTQISAPDEKNRWRLDTNNGAILDKVLSPKRVPDTPGVDPPTCYAVYERMTKDKFFRRPVILPPIPSESSDGALFEMQVAARNLNKNKHLAEVPEGEKPKARRKNTGVVAGRARYVVLPFHWAAARPGRGHEFEADEHDIALAMANAKEGVDVGEAVEEGEVKHGA